MRWKKCLNSSRALTTAALLIGCVAVVVTSGCVVAPRTAHESEKVAVCHKGKKTLVLPRSAVAAHLGHGDTRGPCG